MRLALAYVHMEQFYVGGLLKRAARRLGLDVVSAGPAAGSWIESAPPEAEWRPDIEMSAPGPLPVETDALVNVDQGDGFYCTAPRGIPVAHVFTEGNEGEYARATSSEARAVWALQPFKDVARPTDVRWLEWGYDPGHTPVTPAAATRPVDFVLRGSTGYGHRQELARAFRGTVDPLADVGPPVARAEWGSRMRRACMTLQDHRVPAVPGRIADAVVSGCLVLSVPNAVMPVYLPRGYVEIAERDPETVAAAIRAWSPIERRGDVVAHAQRLVAGHTWDNQLLRVLGSIGVVA